MVSPLDALSPVPDLASVTAARCRSGGVARAPFKSATGLRGARWVATAKRMISPHFCMIRCADSKAPRASIRRARARKSAAVSSAAGRAPIQGNTLTSSQASTLTR